MAARSARRSFALYPPSGDMVLMHIAATAWVLAFAGFAGNLRPAAGLASAGMVRGVMSAIKALGVGVAAACLILGTNGGHANDSTAQLATSGLIFVHNDHVELRQEELFISASEVKVRYRFFNKTDRDVKVLVAFPMPEIKAEQEVAIALPSDDPVNALDFSTVVNGRKVETQVEQRVIAAGIDRTKYLLELGLPLAPHLGTTNDALDRLPREKWDELIRLGLADIEEYDIGKGMQQHLAARWTLRTTFYWEQVFPAKTETLIEHRYRPSVGETAARPSASRRPRRRPGLAEYGRKYCVDKGFLGWRRTAPSGKRISRRPLPRNGSTTSSRPAPTGQARSANSVWWLTRAIPTISSAFCEAGAVKKIAPTQFEVLKKDYRPEGTRSSS